MTFVPPGPGIFPGMAYFPFVPPKSEMAADLELKFEQRGRYSEDSFGLATRFPFAFLTKTRHVSLQREVLVYPRIEPTDEFFEILPLVRGEWESFVRGRGSDLYRIREYMPEDSARHVDWKATAKSGSLKVREFAREDERKLCIVFDNPEPGLVSERAYESAVDMTASLAWHFAQSSEVSYAVPGRLRTKDLHEFLGCLAVIQPSAGGEGLAADQDTSVPNGLSGLNPSATDSFHIVVTGRAHGSLPTSLWNSSYFLFMEDETRPAGSAR